jgi:phosphoribosylformylglycinamidine synthase
MGMKEPKITPELIEQHGLSPQEYQRIKAILRREPNYTELGIFSVMWSEHCSYKSSKVHLKKFPTKGNCLLQGPGENAGVVDIGDGYAAVFKIESHNHPSFIEPYQGAATGVGGIIRDIFTMGARPIALLNSLRFGSLEEVKNRYLLSGVVSGIAGYGNAVGVPTVGGEVLFSSTYSQNPLVNVFCLGVAKKDKIFLGRAKGVGNPVIYVGSKTGRDGIHGATMASEEFDETSEQRRPTVQVGDPFTEKLLIEACLELMETDVIVGIQDMGAAGLTCSSCEMASRGRTGIEIDLAKVPRREPGMMPYEVMLSESQERMLVVVKKGQEKKAKDIFKKWGLEVAVIGQVTKDGKMRVREGHKIVAQIPARPLAEDGPVYKRPMKEPAYLKQVKKWSPRTLPLPKDYNELIFKLLSSPALASKEMIYQQYDHMLFLNTLLLPGSDAAVLRIKGTSRALAITADGNGRYVYLDPFLGGMIAVAEAARNVAATGAKPLAITNCLNFGNPEHPEIMWQFARCVEGMSKACRALDTPVTGGNVSFYNETLGQAVYPTPVVGMIGLLEDASCAVSADFKAEGDIVILLGKTLEELGGTEYLKVYKNLEVGKPPALDLEREKALHGALVEMSQRRLLSSSHDCSEGGLGVALAESSILSQEKGLGAVVVLKAKIRPDALLFGESQSRAVVSCPPDKVKAITAIARKRKVPLQVIGQVATDKFEISVQRKKLITTKPKMLREAWRGALSSYFK